MGRPAAASRALAASTLDCATSLLPVNRNPNPWHPQKLPPSGTPLLPLQTCTAFVLMMQGSIGVLLPHLLLVRREASAAVSFGRRCGIPASDRRMRIYTWLHKATSLPTDS